MSTICPKCKYRICICPDLPEDTKTDTPTHYENGGEDIIDRTFRTGTAEEIRGAMKFNITKYADRLDKKDSEIDELTKIINYATRYRNHLINKEAQR